MKLNQELVQRLAAGEIQLKNTGTVEQLQEILNAAFPDDIVVTSGTYVYYYKHEDTDSKLIWDCDDNPPTLPIYTTEQFFEPETETFVLEETVLGMPKQDFTIQCDPNENPYGEETAQERGERILAEIDALDYVPDVRKMDKETRELAKKLFRECMIEINKMLFTSVDESKSVKLSAMQTAIKDAKQFIQLLNNE